MDQAFILWILWKTAVRKLFTEVQINRIFEKKKKGPYHLKEVNISHSIQGLKGLCRETIIHLQQENKTNIHNGFLSKKAQKV